jgi:ABC-type uncharacterized transport system auxiliary subunit
VESHPHDTTARSEGAAMKRLRLVYSLALALAGTLSGAGCGSVRYPAHYVLNFPAPLQRIAPPEVPGPLVVREFQCPQYLCDGRLVYRPTPEEIGFYEFHRWAMNPRQMITRYIAETVRMKSLFSHVVLEDAGVQPAYVLNGHIERLEEVDQGAVSAVCKISAELLDTKTKSIVWSFTASETIPVRRRDVPGVVAGLSTAAVLTIEKVVSSLEAALTKTVKINQS